MEVLYYLVPELVSIRDFFELGGGVLLLIGGLTLVMWALIVERLLYFKIYYPKVARSVINQWNVRNERSSWTSQQIRNYLISAISQDLERHMLLIRTFVTLCPLMGLLGTVTGMVEIFDVMAFSTSGNSRSMAAGVSKATVPTMAGMVSALSGLVMVVYLQGKVRHERALLSKHITSEY